MAVENINKTLEFDDSSEIKGWTNFVSFIPEIMVGMNNRFFSFKNGELYEHHQGERNTFYDVIYPSKVCFIFNDNVSDDKIFKTLFIEGNQPWNAEMSTNYTQSRIDFNEFNKRESRWFAFTRRSEDDTDLTAISVIGLGTIEAYNTADASLPILTLPMIDGGVSVGDKVYKVVDDSFEELGTIHNVNGKGLTLDNLTGTPMVVGDFVFIKKNARIESSSMRGYYLKCELTNDESEHVELFAINTNAVKSFV